MAYVNVIKRINVSADDAWSKLASFEGIEHFSPIERSVVEGKGPGAKRSCFMPDGAEIKEVLSKLDNEQMHFEYKILSGPFPITDYVSNVLVKPNGDEHCEVLWSCNFESDPSVEEDMKNVFNGFYHTMIEGLEEVIKKG